MAKIDDYPLDDIANDDDLIVIYDDNTKKTRAIKVITLAEAIGGGDIGGVEFGREEGEVSTWAEGNSTEQIPSDKLNNTPIQELGIEDLIEYNDSTSTLDWNHRTTDDEVGPNIELYHNAIDGDFNEIASDNSAHVAHLLFAANVTEYDDFVYTNQEVGAINSRMVSSDEGVDPNDPDEPNNGLQSSIDLDILWNANTGDNIRPVALFRGDYTELSSSLIIQNSIDPQDKWLDVRNAGANLLSVTASEVTTGVDMKIVSNDATLTLDDTATGDESSSSIAFSHGANGDIAEIQARGSSTDDSDKSGQLDIRVFRDHDVVPALRDALSFNNNSTDFYFSTNTIPTFSISETRVNLYREDDPDSALDDSMDLFIRRNTSDAGAEIGGISFVNAAIGDSHQARIVAKKTFTGLDQRGTLEFEVRGASAEETVLQMQSTEVDFRVPLSVIEQDGPSIIATMGGDELAEIAFVKNPDGDSQEMGDIVWYENDGTDPFDISELVDSERRGILRLDNNSGTQEFKFYTGSPLGLRATISSDGIKVGGGDNALTDTAIGNIPSANSTGTFTPASNSITLGTDTEGDYTKIGDIVSAWVELDFPTNTNTNNVSLTGLPFNPSHDGTAAVMNDFNSSDDGHYVLHLFTNGRMGVYKNNERQTYAGVSGRHFRCYFTYTAV